MHRHGIRCEREIWRYAKAFSTFSWSKQGGWLHLRCDTGQSFLSTNLILWPPILIDRSYHCTKVTLYATKDRRLHTRHVTDLEVTWLVHTWFWSQPFLADPTTQSASSHILTKKPNWSSRVNSFSLSLLIYTYI